MFLNPFDVFCAFGKDLILEEEKSPKTENKFKQFPGQCICIYIYLKRIYMILEYIIYKYDIILQSVGISLHCATRSDMSENYPNLPSHQEKPKWQLLHRRLLDLAKESKDSKKIRSPNRWSTVPFVARALKILQIASWESKRAPNKKDPYLGTYVSLIFRGYNPYV